MWACLAGMAMKARELSTAEVAYAACGAFDKLQHVLHMKDIPSSEGRSAELALFHGNFLECETILLQVGSFPGPRP